jgi:predicted dehydrogenase
MLKLYGDMGTIEYDVQKCYKENSDNCIRIFRDVPGLGMQESKPLMKTGKTHADMYRHFFDCIRSGKQSISNGERALVVMRVLDAIDESIRLGGKQVNI